ncbi:MAG TPA: glycosyltransferase family 9 protein [Candidatus Baltobacteraceae bacterium]|nr:glycosyltransferase family 9 protein [Candidatus Baltobacteraceae bacterium]
MSASALLYCAGGGIGDSLVASVVARALRSRFSRVDALSLPSHRSTLERCADIDEVLVDQGDVEGMAGELRERGYDACAVTWATARAAQIVTRAKIPIRVGQARRLYSRSFTHRVLVRSERGDVTSPWVDVLLDYARALDCDVSDRIPSFVPSAQDHADAQALLAKLNVERFIIMHPTNAIAPQRGIWPTQGWSALARALRERFDVPVLVSGSSADRTINEAIVAESEATSIAGELGIGAFGALAQRASAFVGITTGSMHVAAAVGAPTVGIFPFQSDFPERWAPMGRSTGVVRASFRCHPGDTKETCADYACIANLDVPRIVAAVSALLA